MPEIRFDALVNPNHLPRWCPNCFESMELRHSEPVGSESVTRLVRCRFVCRECGSEYSRIVEP